LADPDPFGYISITNKCKKTIPFSENFHIISKILNMELSRKIKQCKLAMLCGKISDFSTSFQLGVGTGSGSGSASNCKAKAFSTTGQKPRFLDQNPDFFLI
jgi:hypothetical protein